jgi:hypothetical protein
MCGQATDSVDSYIVCEPCIADLEPSGLWSLGGAGDGQADEDDTLHAETSQDEIDARVRKLLDDW